MIVNIVLVLVGPGLVVAGGLVRDRAFPGRRIAARQMADGGPSPQVLVILGMGFPAWSQTQLQERYWGSWAWLILIPLAVAVLAPVVGHNLSVAAADVRSAGNRGD